jgi:hypothetical protein
MNYAHVYEMNMQFVGAKHLGCYNHCLEHQGDEVIRVGAPALSLRGMGLRLSVAPGLDGVTDVVIIANPVACGGTTRRKVTPSLLPRLSTPGPRLAEAVTRGVIAAPRRLLGVSVRAPPIGSGCHLGWLGERGAAPRGRTLGLLLEGNAKEPLHLV